MKRPSFQFYPSDWLRDTALRSCSTGARGLWMDMICFMHEGNPYGYLKVGDKVILPPNLARMVGESLEDVQSWLVELQVAAVFDVDNGVICSRRMIRDEELRQKRAEGGKLGGNPKLKVNLDVIQEVKQNSTPSSSSSSTSTTKKTKTQAERPGDVSQSVWDDFIAIRNKVKKPFTETALKIVQREAAKAGFTLEQALETSCARGWQGFEAKWVLDKQTASEARLTQMAALTRGLATPKPAPANFWAKPEQTVEVSDVERKRLL
jgi:hypothetical protein